MGQNIVNPLSWQVPIVNKDGTPTDEFMRKWEQQATTNSTIPVLSTVAQVSAVIDIIDDTPGDILIRGSTTWEGVAPLTLFDAAGAAAAAQTAAELFATNADAVVLAAAEAFSANANNLTSGTVAAARLPIATTAAFGAVKPDGVTVTIAAGVISAVGGGGGSGTIYSSNYGNFSSSANTTAHATKGSIFKPLKATTITSISAPINAVAGQTYQACIFACTGTLARTTTTLQVRSTAVTIAVTASQVVTFPITSTVLPPGQYVIWITWTNAPTTASVNPILGGTLLGWTGLPVDTSNPQDGGSGVCSVNSILPSTGDTFTPSSSGVQAAIQLEATV